MSRIGEFFRRIPIMVYVILISIAITLLIILPLALTDTDIPGPSEMIGDFLKDVDKARYGNDSDTIVINGETYVKLKSD